MLSSEIILDTRFNKDSYTIQSHSDKFQYKDGITVLSKLTKYMKNYFDFDTTERFETRAEKLEEVKIEEIMSEIEEVSPDEILERLWEEEAII